MITGAGDKARFEFSLDEFEVLRFSGSEALCAPYSFQIDLVTTLREIPFDKLVGQPARLTIRGQDQAVRYVHGVLMRLDVISVSTKYITCTALLAPAQAKLDLRRKLRVFQDLSTPQIVSMVLEEGGVSGLDWERLQRDSYPPRNFCVQYRESDLDFIERLLQEEGIASHFEHAEDAVKTVFTDHNSALNPIEGDPELPYNTITSMAADAEFVSQFRFGQQLCSGQVTLRDYNFKNPRAFPEGVAPGVDPSLEVYDYPGEFVVADLGQRLATIRLEQLQQERRVASGASNCMRLQPGFRFTLGQQELRHPWKQLNREYLLVRVGHSGSQESVLGEEGGHGSTTYSNSFTVIPADTPFRPPLNAVRPKALGIHTARVVGPQGEQIHVDRYGRVKLRFHWDRENKSTSWVRVSQEWAGGGYGALFIPRVGQEVLVSFLEGDPDRPVVVGRVYNGEQEPPCGLPQDSTFSTIKSNSSPPQSGNLVDTVEGLQDDRHVNQGANELRFDDRQGQEQVFIHAQHNYRVLTKYDRTTLVKRDRVETIMHDQRVTVGADQIVEVTEAAEHRAKHLVFQATDKLTLKVGDSAVVLTPDCIKIGCGKFLSSATQTNDLRGGLVSFNGGPERVKAGPGAVARRLGAAVAAPLAGGVARGVDAFKGVPAMKDHNKTSQQPLAGKPFVDGPSADDVRQGQAGDCYLLCSLASLAQRRPDLIENMIQPVSGSNPPSYSVKFYVEKVPEMLQYVTDPMAQAVGEYQLKKNVPISATIDTRVPQEQIGVQKVAGKESPLYVPVYGTSNQAGETWVGLVEKGYAQAFGGGKGYEGIGQGGFPGDAMEHLTGAKSDYDTLAFNKRRTWKKLNAANARGDLITASSEAPNTELSDNSPIVTGHCYTVTGVSEKNGQRMVHLRNPWGTEGKRADGKEGGNFSMPYDQFYEDFRGVSYNTPPK